MMSTLEFDDSLSYQPISMKGFNALIGPIQFATVGDAEWRFYLDIEERHTNVVGVCHGGVLLSMVDVGMGASAFRACGHNPVATIELDAKFVAGARRDHRAHGQARLVRMVKGLLFMESEVWSNGRCVMRASGIWKKLDRDSPPSPAAPASDDGK